jgi:WD40 repeat protein
MALKSGLYKDDNELRSLLALQAYKFNKENNSTDRDPLIYNALRNALNAQNKNKGSSISRGMEVKAFCEENDTLFYIGRGSYILKAYAQTDVRSGYTCYLNFNDLGHSDVVEFGNTCKNIITSHNNCSVAFWNTSNVAWSLPNGARFINPVVLKGHRGIVRGLSFSCDEKLIAAGGKDSMILIWDIEHLTKESKGTSPANADHAVSKEAVPRNNFRANSAVKETFFSNNGEQLYSLQEDGKIIIYNISEGSSKEFELAGIGNAKPSCMAINRKTGGLIVGLSNGNIWLQRKKGDEAMNKKENMSTMFINGVAIIKAHASAVEFIAFNKDYSQFASAGSDMGLRIFLAADPDENVLSIDDLGSKVRSMCFIADGSLVVGGSDRNMHFYQTSLEKISEELSPMVKRNMSEIEWKKFCKGIAYEKTISQLP